MKNRVIYIFSIIALICVLSVSLVACERDYNGLKDKLEAKGFNVSITEKNISDEQLNFVSKDKLKWSLKATRNIDSIVDVKDSDVLFVFQYKNSDAADVAINDIINNHSDFKYKVGDKEIDFTYKRVTSYIYYGNFRAVINASNLTLYQMELKESNLFYQGYKTKANRNHGALISDDSQLPFINKELLNYKISATKIDDSNKDIVFIFDYNKSEDAQQQFEAIPNSISYKYEGNDFTFIKKVEGSTIYIGTTTAVNNAINMI